jgi:hypothetical protein
MNPFFIENERIPSFLMSVKDEPWQRGIFDCVTFINLYADEVFDKPYANPDDYPFHDFKTAVRACRRICKDNGVRHFNEVLDKHYHRIDLPEEGCIVAKEDNEGITGYTYGVCYDGFGYFAGDDGLQTMELNPAEDHYWSVE